jgi:hypothetical protein
MSIELMVVEAIITSTAQSIALLRAEEYAKFDTD